MENSPFLLNIEGEETIDINYVKDFEFAKKIMMFEINLRNKKLRMIKLKLNSCILSDILNSMNIKNFLLKNFKQNIYQKKLFGHVRPIQIRKLKEHENPNGIYDCLRSYDSVNEGDIIFVNNMIDDKAYFGDLNATIAISKGAQGTIVNGSTRDEVRTIELDFPVYYKNTTCDDVKNTGTLDYFDEPVVVDGITINVNQLIFADKEGIIIIPKKYENQIIEKCYEVINNENNIFNSLIKGTDISTILNTYGNF